MPSCLGSPAKRPPRSILRSIEGILAGIRQSQAISLGGALEIPFHESTDLLFHRNQMYPDPGQTDSSERRPIHSVRFRRRHHRDRRLLLDRRRLYPLCRGVRSRIRWQHARRRRGRKVPYPFCSAAELLATAATHNLTIAELLLANEVALLADATVVINRPEAAAAPDASPEAKIRASILMLWQAMQECTERGIATEGILPGGLNVRRRAHRLAERLNTIGSKDPLAPIDWVTVYAMAVNEENAAGGRVVTAPTNGAAGVIPAIGNYYMRFIDGTAEEKQEGILRYFLTAAAIGILYKENASISGAEVGCQGEVGVACSMAAGGLVAALNGTNAQVEHAAEIAMEHNLGMTCDPIGGLVQIPCIERNGMGAVKAINAAAWPCMSRATTSCRSTRSSPRCTRRGSTCSRAIRRRRWLGWL